MRMSDNLRDFDKKNEAPKHKTDLADEITQALGINGVYVSVSLTNEEMHLNKLDFSEHDKVFEDKIARLEENVGYYKDSLLRVEKNCDKLYHENKELKQRIAELEDKIGDRDEINRCLREQIVELESRETQNPTKLNLNDRVKVKLTPLGVEIYYHQYDELNKRIKERGGKQLEPRMPEIDKDGYTEFTLWNFIELYGEHIGMCKKNVIEPLYIELCQDEWKMRYNEEPIEK